MGGTLNVNILTPWYFDSKNKYLFNNNPNYNYKFIQKSTKLEPCLTQKTLTDTVKLVHSQ